MAKPIKPRRYWQRLISQHAVPGKDRSKSRRKQKEEIKNSPLKAGCS